MKICHFSRIVSCCVFYIAFSTAVVHFFTSIQAPRVFVARCYASAAFAIMQCLCICLSVRLFVCLSRSYILSKRIEISSKFVRRQVATPFYFSIPNGMVIFWWETPNGGIKCRWGRQKSRCWAYIWLHCLLLMLQQARCCQHGWRWSTATVPQVLTLILLVVYCGYYYYYYYKRKI